MLVAMTKYRVRAHRLGENREKGAEKNEVGLARGRGKREGELWKNALWHHQIDAIRITSPMKGIAALLQVLGRSSSGRRSICGSIPHPSSQAQQPLLEGACVILPPAHKPPVPADRVDQK